MGSLVEAAARVRDGANVLVFPEGTRSRDGNVQTFKKGAFVLASQAGVPIVPVAIEGSGRCFPPDGFRIRPGVIRVKLGAPIATRGLVTDDIEDLVRQTREAIIRMTEALRVRLHPQATVRKTRLARRATLAGARPPDRPAVRNDDHVARRLLPVRRDPRGRGFVRRRSLEIAVAGLVAIALARLAGGGFDWLGLAEGQWSKLANLFGLLVGFALVADHFELSHLPERLPRLLPRGALGCFVLLALVWVLSGVLDNIAAALIGVGRPSASSRAFTPGTSPGLLRRRTAAGPAASSATRRPP